MQRRRDGTLLKPWKAYLQFVKPYTLWIILTLIIGALKFGIPLLLPLIQKYIIDSLLLNETMPVEDKIRLLALVLAGAFVLFVVVRIPIEYYRQYFAQLVTSRILFDIRNKLYEHLQRLSVRFYQNRKV